MVTGWESEGYGFKSLPWQLLQGIFDPMLSQKSKKIIKRFSARKITSS